MHRDSSQPRPRGTGSLLRHTTRAGDERWYGKWRIDGQQVMRVLGPIRTSRLPSGLTRPQAEAALRRAIADSETPTPLTSTVHVGSAGDRLLDHMRALGRKR